MGGLPIIIITNYVGVVGHRKIGGLPSTVVVNCIGVNTVSIMIIRWSGGKCDCKIGGGSEIRVTFGVAFTRK